MKTPTIAITMGDPAGVGAEVTLKALSDPATRALARWLVIGDPYVLEQAQQQTGVTLDWQEVATPTQLDDTKINLFAPLRIDPKEFAIGKISPLCGKAAMEYVRSATLLCLDGTVDAMVTAPLNKEAVALNGIQFSGHTEFIAELCNAKTSRMLLYSERMRVIHVSTHWALRKATEVDAERIRLTIQLGDETLKLMGFKQPRIAVCGINPHAGEHGLFGTEEITTVSPAIDLARAQGIHCEGPFAGDTIFLRALKGDFDLVVAMYHDQGHIPMKLVDFENTVNVSVGLPIIRTSVDHGTAFDIAGKNKASPNSMKAALKLAVTMAANRN